MMNVVAHEKLEGSASESASSWWEGAEQLGQPLERGLRTSCPTPRALSPLSAYFYPSAENICYWYYLKSTKALSEHILHRLTSWFAQYSEYLLYLMLELSLNVC